MKLIGLGMQSAAIKDFRDWGECAEQSVHTLDKVIIITKDLS